MTRMKREAADHSNDAIVIHLTVANYLNRISVESHQLHKLGLRAYSYHWYFPMYRHCSHWTALNGVVLDTLRCTNIENPHVANDTT